MLFFIFLQATLTRMIVPCVAHFSDINTDHHPLRPQRWIIFLFSTELVEVSTVAAQLTQSIELSEMEGTNLCSIHSTVLTVSL